MARLYLRGRHYWIRCSVDGHEYRFSAKTTSERVAERILAKVETEISEARFLDRKRQSRWTLAELGRLYLPRMEQLKPRSARWRKDRFARLLERLGGETPIEAIGPETLDRYAAERLGAGRAASTVRSDVSVLRHALRQAHRWRSETGLSEYRLADWTAPRGREPRQPRFLTREEVGRLLRAGAARARALPVHRRAEVLLRLALATGGRVGELCRVRREDFDERRGWVRIRAMKGGRDRSFALDPLLSRDLRRLFEAGEEPFGGAAAAKDRFRRFWRSARAAARLSDVRFHDLRHTFATEYLRRGATQRALQDQLGHVTSRMTDRYSHSSKRKVPPAAIAWARPGQKPHTADS